jgi:hypothetical protein
MAEKKMVEYVVQVAHERVTNTGLGNDTAEKQTWQTWADVAKVTVATGTYRKTVIERGLAQANLVLEVGGEPLLVRALDEDSARHWPVSSVQPPARLVIGGE